MNPVSFFLEHSFDLDEIIVEVHACLMLMSLVVYH